MPLLQPLVLSALDGVPKVCCGLRAVPSLQNPCLCVPSCHSSIQLKLSPVPCCLLQRGFHIAKALLTNPISECMEAFPPPSVLRDRKLLSLSSGK